MKLKKYNLKVKKFVSFKQKCITESIEVNMKAIAISKGVKKEKVDNCSSCSKGGQLKAVIFN